MTDASYSYLQSYELAGELCGQGQVKVEMQLLFMSWLAQFLDPLPGLSLHGCTWVLDRKRASGQELTSHFDNMNIQSIVLQ